MSVNIFICMSEFMQLRVSNEIIRHSELALKFHQLYFSIKISCSRNSLCLKWIRHRGKEKIATHPHDKKPPRIWKPSFKVQLDERGKVLSLTSRAYLWSTRQAVASWNINARLRLLENSLKGLSGMNSPCYIFRRGVSFSLSHTHTIMPAAAILTPNFSHWPDLQEINPLFRHMMCYTENMTN